MNTLYMNNIHQYFAVVIVDFHCRLPGRRHYEDLLSNLRLPAASRHQYEDILAHLRLPAAGQYEDPASPLRLPVRQNEEDYSSRLRQPSRQKDNHMHSIGEELYVRRVQ